jgi:Immunoglobulin I-set domain/Immunoglobulin domain/Beta-propeller repeat
MPRRMKTILTLKRAFLALGCVGTLSVFAFSPLAPLPTALGNLPLWFQASPEPAFGQAQFVTRGANYQFLLSPTEVRIALSKSGVEPADVQMNFAGASPGAQMSGTDELPGKVNYLIGNDPGRWHTGVATFARVQVEQLYPGVNLVYYGDQRQLEYDFVIAPGTDPGVIRIHFNGVEKISIGNRGELHLAVGGGEIQQPAPVIYQLVHGMRQIVDGGYRLLDRQTVAFTVGPYDHNLPLVIDPVLYFSTYFGGNSSDTAWSMALDTNGFIYIAGQTLSTQKSANNTAPFSTSNAFQIKFAGGSQVGDAFVAKFDSQGSNLIYLTYLGGSVDDAAYGIAVDGNGDAYIAGATDSPNFPIRNGIYTNISGVANPHLGTYPADVFVAKVDPGGSNLLYSTYLGGESADAAYAIALDSSNNAYVTGFTYSTNFPTTLNALQKYLACPNTFSLNANAFVTEIGASGTSLVYSSYLGGTNFDTGRGIAIDSSNYVYVTGFTSSTNFPTTNAVQQQFVSVILTTNAAPTNVVFITNVFNGYLLNGTNILTAPFDGFVAKFTPSCAGFVYSTFLGGVNNDVPYQISVDALDNAYVTGSTVSTNFPNTITNLAGLGNGLANNTGVSAPLITNAFLTQIMWSGTNAAIGWSTAFGGTNFGIDIGYGVTVDPSGNVFVVGASSTTNFPAVNTPGLLRMTNSGTSDAFVIAFTPNCSNILYSGYLGGSGNDYGYGIAVDAQTNVYLAGQTFSANFPTIFPFQSSLNGTSDAFLAKIGWTVLPPEITTQPTNQLVETGVAATFNVTATGTPPLSYQWQFQGTNLMWTNLVNGGPNLVSGATSATLTISSPQTNESGNYQVIVTNYAGSTTSSVAVLTVTDLPRITQQPTNQTVGVGANVTNSIGGFATQPFTLQWLKDGINLTNGTNVGGSLIVGATSASLTIKNVQTNDEGNYWIIVTNNFGAVTSSVAVLTVVSLPTIIVPPTNQMVGLGSQVIFPVTAVGAIPLGYQWQLDGTNLLNGGRIGGTTNSVLTISNAQITDDGGYTVIVTNVFGAVTSSPPAVLTVLAAPLFGGITAASGTNGVFILTGAGGTNNGTYSVLTSTNLAIPLGLWTSVGSNHFNSLGQFVFTNIAPTDAAQLFYILQTQ